MKLSQQFPVDFSSVERCLSIWPEREKIDMVGRALFGSTDI